MSRHNDREDEADEEPRDSGITQRPAARRKGRDSLRITDTGGTRATVLTVVLAT